MYIVIYSIYNSQIPQRVFWDKYTPKRREVLVGEVGINEVLEVGDGTKALAILAEAKDLCKKGKIIELMDFLCPEDTQYSYDNRTKTFNKR